MHDILRNIDIDTQKRKAWVFSLVLCAYVTLFMFNGSNSDTDISSITRTDPITLLIIQGFVSAILFIGVSLLFARFLLKLNPSDFFPKTSPGTLALIVPITLCFMVVNSAIGEWNMSLDFPDSSFETWAKRSEEQLKVLTEHITNFNSPLHFVIAFIVVAIIPGIGEELLFRGLVQNFFSKAFSNHHVAIWVTGFIFAAIHMQFYGVIPRTLLGVLFGYIYYWSANLSLAMIAHIVNNGLALTLLYLSQSGAINVTPDQMESSAPWPAILLFGSAGSFLLWKFYTKNNLSRE
ncbi:MAG: CPBP family intramembrane glutamic endopeptidase [Bacteroidota bacterium]